MEQENLTIPDGLDPEAVNLARAIRKQESGGDYNRTGDDGSSLGAYQWNNQPAGKSVPLKKGEIPSNFKAWAKEVGLDANDFSPKNQDMVAYKKIKKLKDAGNNVVDIAAIWNGGDAKRQDPNYVTPSGLPSQKKGIYDVPAYAKAVNDYYQGLKEKTGDTSNTNTEDLTKDKMPDLTPPDGPTYTSALHSPERLAQYQAEAKDADQKSKDANSLKGKAYDTAVGIGDRMTLGGASVLGNQLGTGLSKTYNQAKGLVGLQDNSKYMEDMSPGKTALGLTGTLLGIATQAGPGLQGIFSKGEAAIAPELVNSIRNTIGKTAADEFVKGNPVQKYNILKSLSESEKVTSAGKLLIDKTLADLEPAVMKAYGIVTKSSGLLPKLKTAGKVAGIGLLGGVADRLLGSKVSGVAKGLISSL